MMNDYLCHHFYFIWKRMFKRYVINTLMYRGASLSEAKEIAECEIEAYSRNDKHWKYPTHRIICKRKNSGMAYMGK